MAGRARVADAETTPEATTDDNKTDPRRRHGLTGARQSGPVGRRPGAAVRLHRVWCGFIRLGCRYLANGPEIAVTGWRHYQVDHEVRGWTRGHAQGRRDLVAISVGPNQAVDDRVGLSRIGRRPGSEGQRLAPASAHVRRIPRSRSRPRWSHPEGRHAVKIDKLPRHAELLSK